MSVNICGAIKRQKLKAHFVVADILLSNKLYLTAGPPVTKQKLFPLLHTGAHKVLFTGGITQTAVCFGVDCCSHMDGLDCEKRVNL